MGTASGETPQMPLHRQGTLPNYSPGLYSKNQGLQTLGEHESPLAMSTVLLASRRHPAPTQKGFCSRAQSKMVCRENSWCSHDPARDTSGTSTTATSALGTAAKTPQGVFCHKGSLHCNRTDLQD